MKKKKKKSSNSSSGGSTNTKFKMRTSNKRRLEKKKRKKIQDSSGSADSNSSGGSSNSDSSTIKLKKEVSTDKVSLGKIKSTLTVGKIERNALRNKDRDISYAYTVNTSRSIRKDDAGVSIKSTLYKQGGERKLQIRNIDFDNPSKLKDTINAIADMDQLGGQGREPLTKIDIDLDGVADIGMLKNALKELDSSIKIDFKFKDKDRGRPYELGEGFEGVQKFMEAAKGRPKKNETLDAIENLVTEARNIQLSDSPSADDIDKLLYINVQIDTFMKRAEKEMNSEAEKIFLEGVKLVLALEVDKLTLDKAEVDARKIKDKTKQLQDDNKKIKDQTEKDKDDDDESKEDGKNEKENEEAKAKREREELVNQRYKDWLKSKNMIGKKPNEVLSEYGNNWFKLKKELAYSQENDSSENYQMRLAAMEKILLYRKELVDGLLQETIDQITGENDLLEDGDINASAFGSVTPTSDYDITFEIAKHPELEHLCVKRFNTKFREKFGGITSGVLFDTNVYTNGFMPSDIDKVTTYIDKFNPNGETRDLSASEQELVKEGKRMKQQTQMALSLVAIAQSLTPEGWNRYKDNTINVVKNSLINQGVDIKTIEKLVFGQIEIFAKAEDLHRETTRKIQERKNLINLFDKYFDDAHLEGLSKDTLYEDTLEEVSEPIEKLKSNAEKLKKSNSAEERKILLVKRAELISKFEENQGKALIYSNEAYFSGGAAVHVVKGLQANGDFKLGRQQKIQSILMNVGYQINHFNHQLHDSNGNIGRALLNTAKYGQRIAHLATNAQNNIDLSTEAIKLMDFETKLITEVKKDNKKFPTPSDKEREVLRRWNESFSGEDATKLINSVYQEVASKSIAPFHIDKWKETKEIEKVKDKFKSVLTEIRN